MYRILLKKATFFLFVSFLAVSCFPDEESSETRQRPFNIDQLESTNTMSFVTDRPSKVKIDFLKTAPVSDNEHFILDFKERGISCLFDNNQVKVVFVKDNELIKKGDFSQANESYDLFKSILNYDMQTHSISPIPGSWIAVEKGGDYFAMKFKKCEYKSADKKYDVELEIFKLNL